MKKLSLDTKLLLVTFTGTFALVLALGLRAPAGASAADADFRRPADSPTPSPAALGAPALQAGRPSAPEARPEQAQANAGQPYVAPVVPTPPEVIEADRWAVAEPPNNNY